MKLKLPFALLAALAAGTLALAAETENAVPIRTVAAQYPIELRRERVSGVVTLSFTVNERGEVVEPSVVKSTRREFEVAALNAVRHWRFKPAKENGAPVSRKVVVPIEFHLDD